MTTKERGVTLIELLVAMAVSGVLIAAIYTTFVTQQKSYTVQDQVAEAQQNARVGLDMMVREVRMAGYGKPSWPLSADTNGDGVYEQVNDPVTVVNGDRITIVGCFEPAPTTLSAQATAGSTTLTLQNATDQINTTTESTIFIGGFENAQVTAISGSGQILTIDTDPNLAGNQGLARNYSAGSEVNIVRAVTYSLSGITLVRDENCGAGAQTVAENIENLQLSFANNIVNISLTARSSSQDPNYRDPLRGDHYRRKTLTSNVNVRNLLYQVEENG